MVVGVTTMIINVIGCYVLIEPRFGLPGYGVAGSAWAAVIATWSGFLVALAALLTGTGYREVVPIVKVPWRSLRKVEFLRVLRFGLPSGVNWFLEFSAFALFVNAIVTHLGTTTLAAFNVMIQINSVSFMPAFGLASAGAVLVGEAIGRRALSEVPRSVKLTIAVAAAWMLCVGTLYLLIPEHLVGLFTSRSGEDAGELLRIGTLMLMISAVWQMFDAIGMTLSEALRAAGDTTWCMVARIVLAWGCFVPGAWFAIFLRHGGIGSVMLALASYIGLSSLAFAFRFWQGRWRNIDLVGVEPELVVD
jgi:MATE family multidrug resistance protein